MKGGCAGSPHNKMTGYEDSICQAKDCPGQVFPLRSHLTDFLRSVCAKGLGVPGSMRRTRHTVVLMGLLQGRDTEQVSKGNAHDGRRNLGEPGILLQESPVASPRKHPPARSSDNQCEMLPTWRLSKDSMPTGAIWGRGSHRHPLTVTYINPRFPEGGQVSSENSIVCTG